LEELTKAQQNETLSLPGSWETIDSVSYSIADIVNFGLPDDYYSTYPEKVRALSVSDVAKAAQKAVHPDQLVWVVVGDRMKIEPGLSELGWGEVHLLDADGTPIEKAHTGTVSPIKE
jgi:zinc protease